MLLILAKAKIVSRIITHMAIISARAQPTWCWLKKIKDQKKLSSNWTAKRIIAVFFTESAASDLQTRNKAIPISMYNVVHTGPKIQLGGFHDGLVMVWYQVPTEEAVKNPLTPPTIRGMLMERISLAVLLINDITTRVKDCLQSFCSVFLVVSNQPGHHFIVASFACRLVICF